MPPTFDVLAKKLRDSNATTPARTRSAGAGFTKKATDDSLVPAALLHQQQPPTTAPPRPGSSFGVFVPDESDRILAEENQEHALVCHLKDDFLKDPDAHPCYKQDECKDTCPRRLFHRTDCKSFMTLGFCPHQVTYEYRKQDPAHKAKVKPCTHNHTIICSSISDDKENSYLVRYIYPPGTTHLSLYNGLSLKELYELGCIYTSARSKQKETTDLHRNLAKFNKLQQEEAQDLAQSRSFQDQLNNGTQQRREMQKLMSKPAKKLTPEERKRVENHLKTISSRQAQLATNCTTAQLASGARKASSTGDHLPPKRSRK